MTRVQAIKEQIESLSPAEFAELREWFFEREASAGSKLEQLFSKALADHAAGKTTKL
jgi:hypothetical protein